MSHTEARNQFEKGSPVIDLLDGRKHSCEEITVTTPLNRKVKVRMKNLGDDVWDTMSWFSLKWRSNVLR